MYSSLSALRTLCHFSDWKLSNLKANKLLYISQMLHIKNCDNAPMFSGQFEAWDYGPVLPEIYHSAKVFGSKPIRDIYTNYEIISEKENAGRILKDAANFGLRKNASTLVAITHWKDGAWAKRYTPNARGVVITNADIAEEIKARRAA